MKILVVVSMQEKFLYNEQRCPKDIWDRCITECAKYIRNEIKNGAIVVAVKDSSSSKPSFYNKEILSALKTAQEDKRYSLEKGEFGAVMLPPMIWDIITVWGVPDEIEFIGADCEKGLVCTALLTQSEFNTVRCSVNSRYCFGKEYESEDCALDTMINAGLFIHS